MATASAVTNWAAAPGMLDPRTFTDLVDKAMDLMWARRDAMESNLAQFFEKKSASLDTYKISDVGSELDLPIKNEDGAPLPYAQPVQGFDKTFTTVNYRRAIRVTDDMRSMDRFGKVQQMIGGLPKAAARLMEYAYADVFNNAFATNIGADGMYMLDTGHPYEDPAAGTWDNLQTGALSDTTFSAARVAMRKRKNARGFSDPVIPTKLLVAPDLEQTARRFLQSEKIPGLALNDVNWNKGVVELVISPWLSSTTAWFVLGDMQGEARGMFYIERVAPNVKPVSYEDPDIIWGRRMKLAFAVGFTTSRNVEGSTGA